MGTTLHPHLTPPHPLRSTTIDNIFRATYTVSTADGAWREQIFERGASGARLPFFQLQYSLCCIFRFCLSMYAHAFKTRANDNITRSFQCYTSA